MDPVQNWVIIFIMNQKTGYLPWNCTIVLGSTILRPFKVTFSQIVTFWTPGAIATLYYLVASVVFIRKVTHFMPEHSWQAKVTKKIATWKVARRRTTEQFVYLIRLHSLCEIVVIIWFWEKRKGNDFVIASLVIRIILRICIQRSFLILCKDDKKQCRVNFTITQLWMVMTQGD